LRLSRSRSRTKNLTRSLPYLVLIATSPRLAGNYSPSSVRPSCLPGCAIAPDGRDPPVPISSIWAIID
jgi:hypothetical protein